MRQALYRRYRPESFADVIGQEHVTEPLMQALRTGRVHHAYLFSGPRGCGKTTSARIMARCLNCEQGPTPEPCGVCESCVALARNGAGTIDVIEIDAASHGGVDDARELRERAAFGPATSRYKVYIIDEAHMVSNQGFNALLKVVEEPPEHVKFIFATTEPDKVISTIRSRTHHYPFHLVPPQRLTAYLDQVCQAEGVALEPGVLSFVTRAGGGSVRDSLSVLDQLISGAGEGGLTYEGTAALLGFTDAELLDAVVDAVAAADAAAVFQQVDKVMESGHDPRRFVEDLLERYRDLIVLSAVGERTGGLLRGLPEDQVSRMRRQASGYGAAALSRCADVVNRGLSEMTGAVSYRLHVELICARLLLPGASGEQGYAARLERIERRLAAGGNDRQPDARPGQSGQPEPAGEQPAQGQPPQRQPTQSQPAQREQRGRQPEQREPGQPQPGLEQPGPGQLAAASARAPGSLDTEAVRRAWPEVLDKVKDIRRVTWTLVAVNSTVLDFDGNRLLLGLGTPGLALTFRDGVHAEVVRQALIDALGLDTRVEGVAGGASDGSDPAVGPAPVAASVGVAARRSPVMQDAAPDWSQGAGAAPSWAHEAAEPSTPASAGEPRSASEARQKDLPKPAGRHTPVPPPGVTPRGDEPSPDDDDLESSGAIGQPVIESVLGGRVISVDDDTAR